MTLKLVPLLLPSSNMPGRYSKKIYNLTTSRGRKALSVALMKHECHRHDHSLYVVTLKCMTCDVNAMIFSTPDQKFADVHSHPAQIVRHINLNLNDKVNKVLSFGDTNGCLIMALIETQT